MGFFRVNVSKDYLGFAAAHFLTFRGHACESLHGHNYRIGVTVEGPIDPECHFVVDFSVIKGLVRGEVERLDHRVLLPADNPKLAYRADDGMTYVSYLGQLTYQFPTRDCIIVPIANTTAEMLARWVAERLRKGLAASGVSPDVLEVEVEESPGQSAVYIERREHHHTAENSNAEP
ncbi:MAG TPA: 6-carboxytetrahydropterin synthase [Gemmatimonadales bacterium]|jgi:6-pyruvoyltetrahydropterin/6-carboxytetrahydropterin synthase